MITTIYAANREPLNSKVEIEPGAIIIHSRGGAFGKPNLRNPDYRKALRIILVRLHDCNVKLSGVWLDSRVAQSWPESERLLLNADECALPIDQIVTLIGQRGSAMGRPKGTAGHGNSTKRVRIGVPSMSTIELQEALSVEGRIRDRRLPAEILRRVQPWMIDEAVNAYRAGAIHYFQESKDYDLLLPSGERVPPKAIFGIALSKILGRPATSADFSAGWGEPCFDIIENAGYPIVAKSETVPLSTQPDADEERSWAEGSPRRLLHLRRERAPGLAQMKKRRFLEAHGFLFCERCGLIPSKALGPFGDACIEVHHDTLAVGDMDGKTRTRLSDLKCLCANCHRIIHREQSPTEATDSSGS